MLVNQWTWAATLLQSSSVAYLYGLSGPYLYAARATIQFFLFGILSIELKRKAPTAHTMCEVFLCRSGRTAHKGFLGFALVTNVIVTAMLLVGGAAVVTSLTGMNIYAASFLIPVRVILYTLSGGLKATFLASYVHTAKIFAMLVYFVLWSTRSWAQQHVYTRGCKPSAQCSQLPTTRAAHTSQRCLKEEPSLGSLILLAILGQFSVTKAIGRVPLLHNQGLLIRVLSSVVWYGLQIQCAWQQRWALLRFPWIYRCHLPLPCICWGVPVVKVS